MGNSLFLLLWAVPFWKAQAQTAPIRPAEARAASCYIPDTLSREAFVGAVAHVIVDNSFSRYYLSDQAYPCSLVKFDYDEWVKYALQEEVPIYILNEQASPKSTPAQDRRLETDRQESELGRVIQSY